MKPLKYKIEIQLKPYAGKIPQPEFYDADNETAAIYIYDFFKFEAQSRSISQWNGKKYVPIKLMERRLEKAA